MLQDYTIISTPDLKADHSVSHLKKGMKVAITKQGLQDHNSHNFGQSVLLGAGLGAFMLPVLVGGGVGLAMGGEAIGLGLAELGIVGGGAGTVVGNMRHKKVAGHSTTTQNVMLIDMLGIVTDWNRRWWDQPGWDVQVKWRARDEFGDIVKFEAWHNPEDLYGLDLV